MNSLIKKAFNIFNFNNDTPTATGDSKKNSIILNLNRDLTKSIEIEVKESDTINDIIDRESYKIKTLVKNFDKNDYYFIINYNSIDNNTEYILHETAILYNYINKKSNYILYYLLKGNINIREKNIMIKQNLDSNNDISILTKWQKVSIQQMTLKEAKALKFSKKKNKFIKVYLLLTSNELSIDKPNKKTSIIPINSIIEISKTIELSYSVKYINMLIVSNYETIKKKYYIAFENIQIFEEWENLIKNQIKSIKDLDKFVSDIQELRSLNGIKNSTLILYINKYKNLNGILSNELSQKKFIEYFNEDENIKNLIKYIFKYKNSLKYSKPYEAYKTLKIINEFIVNNKFNFIDENTINDLNKLIEDCNNNIDKINKNTSNESNSNKELIFGPNANIKIGNFLSHNLNKNYFQKIENYITIEYFQKLYNNILEDEKLKNKLFCDIGSEITKSLDKNKDSFIDLKNNINDYIINIK